MYEQPVDFAVLQKNILEHIALMAQEQVELEFADEIRNQEIQQQMAPIMQQMKQNPQMLQQNPQVQEMQLGATDNFARY